jgi:hypothetical protein
MKITLKNRIDKRLVEFESDLGYGVAIWGGNKPLLNVAYHVELDINDFFQWGRNITLGKKHEAYINLIDNNIVFNAKVISCEDKGVLVLSVANDIVFIETSDTCEVGAYVSFFTTPDKMILHPIEL